MRIAVCDDDAAFLQHAVKLIKRWSDESDTPIDIHTFDNGDALLAADKVAPFDTVFLDILMPLLNGMDTAKELRQKDSNVRIVFLTSSPEFALESYEVEAQGYLLKPAAYDKISAALTACARSMTAQPQYLVARTLLGYRRIYYHAIAFVEAQNKRVCFHLQSGETVLSPEPLHTFEKMLTVDNGFFKCHRSYLVYMPNIEHFNRASITTKAGEIPIARSCATPFKEAYFSLMFREGEV